MPTATQTQRRVIRINRAPVLTLWAAVVAERLGFNRDEALTLGRAVAGLTAHTKAVSLGLIAPTPAVVRKSRKETVPGASLRVELLGRAIPVVTTKAGLRALSAGRPISPESVERYLKRSFGDALDDVRSAMMRLARSMPPKELARRAYALYERFRPDVPAGVHGWGRQGILDLARIERLAR